MDIKPEEKSYHCASSFGIEAINKSNLSRDKLHAYVLDMQRKLARFSSPDG
jgi:hypothetical protein